MKRKPFRLKIEFVCSYWAFKQAFPCLDEREEYLLFVLPVKNLKLVVDTTLEEILLMSIGTMDDWDEIIEGESFRRKQKSH